MAVDQIMRTKHIVATDPHFTDFNRKLLAEAAQFFAETMPQWNEDFEEWSDSEILEEFSFWVAGSRLGPEDEGGPKQEWIDAYWKGEQ